MIMSNHPASGHVPDPLPADDLQDDPGIGQSKCTTIAGENPDLVKGENTVQGDVENDTGLGGGIDPDQRPRGNP